MTSPIVCNTGPLIALSLIACQDILGQLYHPIITRTVFDEWAEGEDDAPRILPATHEIVPAPAVDPLLAVQLDPGEASVIQTALERGILRVLIDERKGRKIARRVCGLETLGTAGLLVEAKRHGLITHLSPLFSLLEEHSYWIAKPIVEWALYTVGE